MHGCHGVAGSRDGGEHAPRMELEPLPTTYAVVVRRNTGSAHALERAAIAHGLVRVRRGAYADPDAWSTALPKARHLTAVLASERAARGTLLLSHESAATIWGMPIIGPWPARVQTTVASPTRTTGPVQRHSARLESRDIQRHESHLVTSPSRTAIDLAASRNFFSGVAAFDFVRRFLGVSVDTLTEEIDRRAPFRGIRPARRALSASTGLCDSALESAFIGWLAELEAPLPEQQWQFTDSHGVRRSGDARWRLANGLVAAAETDGREKYRNPVMLSGRTPDQALWEEKRREDDLRMHCDRFARIYWDDVMGPAGLIRKLDRLGVPHR